MMVEKESVCESDAGSAPWLNRGESQIATKTLLYENRDIKVASDPGFTNENKTESVLCITSRLYINSVPPTMSITEWISPDFVGVRNIKLGVEFRVLATNCS